MKVFKSLLFNKILTYNYYLLFLPHFFIIKFYLYLYLPKIIENRYYKSIINYELNLIIFKFPFLDLTFFIIHLLFS